MALVIDNLSPFTPDILASPSLPLFSGWNWVPKIFFSLWANISYSEYCDPASGSKSGGSLATQKPWLS